MKVITTGHIFLSNDKLSRFINNQVNLYEFLLPWDVSSNLTFEISRNFELQSFELTRFYCIILLCVPGCP
jgi:hypothetical protein